MPGFKRSRFHSTFVRHRPSWEVGPETSANGQPQAITASVSQLAGVAVQSVVDGLTLIRTRGEFLFFVESAAAIANGYHGAFGIAKASTAAIVAGAASVLTPITEEAWDGWLYHRYFSCLSAGPLAVASAAQQALQVNNVTAAVRFEVDSKAMRKLAVDEGIYACIEVIEFGTANAQWAFNCRQLVKDMG